MSDTADAVENPGGKNQVDHPFVRQLGQFIGGQDPLFGSLAPHDLRIDAPAVIAHFDQEAVADPGCLDRNRRRLGFSGRPSLPGIFDTMIQRVTHEMHHGFEKTVDDGLVGFRGFAAGDQRHVLVELAGDIADQSREGPEQLRHRHHPQLQDGAVQFGHQPLDGVPVALDRSCDVGVRQNPARRAWPNAPGHFSQPRVRPPN